jgi:hypothetical protein
MCRSSVDRFKASSSPASGGVRDVRRGPPDNDGPWSRSDRCGPVQPGRAGNDSKRVVDLNR